MNHCLIVAIAVTAAAVPACTGAIGGSGGPLEREEGNPPSGAAPAAPGQAAAGAIGLPPAPESPRARQCRADGPSVAPSPLVRLTTLEYRNTMRELFGGVDIPPVELPRDDTLGAFDGLARSQNPVPAFVEAFEVGARSVAEAAARQLDRFLPCKPGTVAEDEACGRRWIEAFGKRAFRRPLTSDEVTRFTRIFTETRRGHDLPTAVSVATQIFLQSPHFLYRPELGAAARAGIAALTGYELASRLSYLLWDTMPDAVLFAAADAGKLVTAAGVAAEARRMLEDPRARTAVAGFNSQWLRLDRIEGVTKDAKLFPAWNSRVPAAMRDSAEKFVDAVFWEQGSLEALLTDSRAYVNKDLAPFYGVAPPAGADLRRVELDPAQRVGILTQVGPLASFAYATIGSPVQRGLFILDRFLCTHIPDPPPEVNAQPPQPSKTNPPTTRQLFEKQHTGPACAACHRAIDGIGFALEGYDAAGQWRTKENGADVDTRTVLTGVGDLDGSVSGAADLARRMAKSEKVASCVGRQWLGFAAGVETDEVPDCALAPIIDLFTASRFDMKALLLAMVTSDAFRHRRFDEEAAR